PAAEQDANLVLAMAEQAPNDPLRRHRRRRRTLATLQAMVDRRLRWAFAVLLAMLVIGTVLFATVGGYSWYNAIYLTILDVTGISNPDVGLSPARKLTQVLVTLAGIALVPVLFAAVVDAVVRARLAGPNARL